MNSSTTSTSIPLANELRLQIASDLDEHSLAMLSTVSREWTAPANDVLWSNMKTLSPLLHLIPHGITYEPVVPISNDTLVRFDAYAARVRNLEWSDDTWYEGDECFAGFSSLLRSTRAKHPLLPNLQSFRISCKTSEGTRSIAIWLSPSLNTLDIILGLDVDDSASTWILSCAWGRCARLTSLSFRMDERATNPRRATVRMLLAVLRSLRVARQVTVPLYSPEHLAALKGLPVLEELTLFLVESAPSNGGLPNSSMLLGTQNSSLGAITSTSAVTPTSTSIPFSCLRSLTITGSLTGIATIIRSTSTLEHLSLATDCIRHPDEMRCAMQHLAMCCTRLATLTVDIYMLADQEMDWVDWSPLAHAWDGREESPLFVSIQHPCIPAPGGFLFTLPSN